MKTIFEKKKCEYLKTANDKFLPETPWLCKTIVRITPLTVSNNVFLDLKGMKINYCNHHVYNKSFSVVGVGLAIKCLVKSKLNSYSLVMIILSSRYEVTDKPHTIKD
jgi:hypothetical protein